MLTHTRRRILAMLTLLTALLGLAGLPFALPPASADALVTLQGCSPASGSGGGVTCNLQLMVSVNQGGSWKVTVNDPGASVTACDGSSASATCTASGNAAVFMCPSGCGQNSKYTITVQGDANPQNVFFTSVSPGTLATGPATPAGYATAGSGYSAAAYTAPAQYVAQPVAPVPQGGQCVGASYLTAFGCTSAYVPVPINYNYTYSSGYPYAGCYGILFGCGYSYPFLANCNGFFLINGCGSLFSSCFNFLSWGCNVNHGCFGWNWGCGNNNGCWGGNWNCGNNNDHHGCFGASWNNNNQGQQGQTWQSGHMC